MQKTYKNAMNKISANDDFKEHLKSRVVREELRVKNSAHVTHYNKVTKRLMSAVTAAAVIVTVVTASLTAPKLFKKNIAPVKKAPIVTDMQSTEPPVAQFSGSNSVSLAQNLSMRIVSEDNAIKYDTNIFFSFEGFDKYNVETTGSCIVFETALASNYTLANFFEDYYNLIVNGTGISRINNGLIESFFDISDNGMRTISVFDGNREIIDLDTALMSEYKDRDNIHFIITIT